MNIKLIDLVLSFKKGKECIPFSDFNYFYGQMGAGKSTIVRLVDFCLGGILGSTEMTPALQSEFISASLSLSIKDKNLILERDAGSNKIRALWSNNGENFEILVPARKADGEVLPNTGVENLSDLIYFLGGNTPPKVRRSKIKEDSDLERLSFRDLLWYCYLDQDTIDSNFFHLDVDADNFKRLKSRDVLRFIIGFHQEQVAELEVKLECLRSKRQEYEAGVKAIRDVLNSADIQSEEELWDLRLKLKNELILTEQEITAVRNRTCSFRTHAMESSQLQAKELTNKIVQLKETIEDIQDAISKNKSHKNELLSLATRFRRSQSAREVLSGVDFKNCPQCGNELPMRAQENCLLCGQIHSSITVNGTMDENTAEQDLQSRVGELTELITDHEISLQRFNKELREITNKKTLIDTELNQLSKEYDSAYLSAALETEKRRSAIQQQLLDLDKIELMVKRISTLSSQVHHLVAEEQRIRTELKDARERAERDTTNLRRLKTLFLNCLLRAKLPGFLSNDTVDIKSPNFLPEVTSAEGGDLAVTSFTNLGSGGKKTLFKCCFAVAIHRLAVEIGAMLPSFLIIDSPMKNISERENREQFEGFFEMLYGLCASELKGTQFILIDKEICPPPEGFKPSFKSRHMTPDDENNPPLIPYYRGK